MTSAPRSDGNHSSFMIADAHNLLRILTIKQQRVLAAAAHFYFHLVVAEDTVYQRLKGNATHFYHKYFMLNEIVFWLARLAFDHIVRIMLQSTFNRDADDSQKFRVQSTIYNLLMSHSQDVLLVFPPSERADRDIPIEVVSNCPCRLHSLFSHLWTMFMTEYGLHGFPQIRAFLHSNMTPVEFSRSLIIRLQATDVFPRPTTIFSYFPIVPSEEWLSDVRLYSGAGEVIFDTSYGSEWKGHKHDSLATRFRIHQAPLVPTNTLSFSEERLLRLPRKMRGITAPSSMEALVEIVVQQYPGSLAPLLRSANHALQVLEFLFMHHSPLFLNWSHGLARLYLQARLCQLAKNIAMEYPTLHLSVPRLMSLIVESESTEDFDFTLIQQQDRWEFKVSTATGEPLLADIPFEFSKLKTIMTVFFLSTLSPHSYLDFWASLICDEHEEHKCHIDLKCFNGGQTDLVYFRARSLAGIASFQTLTFLTPPPAHKRLASDWLPALEDFSLEALTWDLDDDFWEPDDNIRAVMRADRARATADATRRARSTNDHPESSLLSKRRYNIAHDVDDNAISRDYANAARLSRSLNPPTDRSAYAHAELPRRVPRPHTSDLNIDRLISRPYTSNLNVDISRSAPPSSTLLSDSPSFGHNNAPMEALLEGYSHLVYVESLPEPPPVMSLLPLSPVQPVDTNVLPSTDNDT